MDILRGLRTAPWIVSLARGLVAALVTAILMFLGDATNAVNIPAQWQWIIPLVILVLRQIEGTLDQADSAKHSGGHAVAGRPLSGEG